MSQLDKLQEVLLEWGKIAIAYSGGVDSNFLLAAALECLGTDNVLAVLGKGAMMPEEEAEEAIQYMEHMGAAYLILEVDVLGVPEFAQNDPMRCYHCKKYLMSQIKEAAGHLGFLRVADGKNLDDGKSYRPGTKASGELGILSPLYLCGFTKKDIRDESRRLGLPTWNKPANACLATRFPYHTELTNQKLKQVAKAERCLRQAEIYGGRVRVHGEIARLEIPHEDFQKVIQKKTLIDGIKACGFSFVTLDLEGFRSGSFDTVNWERSKVDFTTFPIEK